MIETCEYVGSGATKAVALVHICMMLANCNTHITLTGRTDVCLHVDALCKAGVVSAVVCLSFVLCACVRLCPCKIRKIIIRNCRNLL